MTTRREHLKLLAAAGATLAVPAAARAQGTTHEVLMLNAHPDNPRERQVFVPAVLQIQPGDTVVWIPEDRGHNSVVDEDMMPEGGATWDGAINEEVSATFDAEGTYGYNCTPHRTAGMVGLILVGDASVNFEEVREVRQRGLAARRYEEYFAEAEEMIAGS
jgi:pseudoazurin